MKYMISALGLCLSASVMQASVHPIEVISQAYKKLTVRTVNILSSGHPQ